MKTVLVVAPRFPAINQPWIDTYLEQLLVNGFGVQIYSANRGGGPYQEKVDRLGLKKYLVDISLEKAVLVKSLFRFLLHSPLVFLQGVWRAVILSKQFVASDSPRVASFLKLFFFISIADKFSAVDVIHSHEEIAAYEFLHLAKVLRVPIIVTFHGLPPKDVGQLSTEKRALLYRNASAVIVNTEFSKAQIVGVGCDPCTIRILPQGLPLEDFPFRESDARPDNQLLRILTVGRFHRDKGQGYALLAAARLKAVGLAFTWHFVGMGPDMKRLLRLVKRLGLDEYVQFHQALDSAALLMLYQDCDFFVLPSIENNHGCHVETQGVVLQEAQACGCVPIASSVGGIPECLHHESDALLVRQKSSKAILRAILTLAGDMSKTRTYQLNGRKNVEKNCSANVVGRRMADILNGVLDYWSALKPG